MPTPSYSDDAKQPGESKTQNAEHSGVPRAGRAQVSASQIINASNNILHIRAR